MRRPVLIVAAALLWPLAAAALAQSEQFPDPEPAPNPDPPAPGMFGRALDGWTGSIEFGMNGSTGNVERFSGRGGVRGERRTDFNHTQAEFIYIFARTAGETSQNEAHLLVRNDRLFEDSPWRIFGLATVDYDKFKDWDVRAAAFLGVGYAFIQTDRTELVGRLGAGLMREFGGDDDSITPEALIGADFQHQVTERQRVTMTADVFPALDDLGDYRWVATAAYEILVDPAVNMSLRIGAESRYDSTPGVDVKRHDLDYFAVLVWSF